MEKIGFILVLLFLTLSSWSQNAGDLVEFDQKTYQLYIEQDWDQLIQLGSLGLDSGVDFYYLRMRLGLAYYHTQRYEKARYQFLKALDFQPKDPNAEYYQYYATLLSGRWGEARLLVPGLLPETQKIINAKPAFSIAGLSLELGRFINNSVDDLESSLPAGFFASSYFNHSMDYQNLGASVHLGYASSLVVAANRFGFSNQQLIRTDGSVYEFEHSNAQTGGYVRYSYQFPGSVYAGLAYHGITGAYASTYLSAYEGATPVFSDSTDTYRQFYAGGFIGGRMSHFAGQLSFAKSSFWQGDRYQVGIGISYYPVGNQNYYLAFKYDFMTESMSNFTGDQVIKLVAGAKVIKGILVEASYLTGNLSNWADANGYYLFNTVYPIQSRAGFSLIFNEFLPRLSFSLSGFVQNREHEATVYDQNWTPTIVLQNYQTYTIFGGLSWIL